MKQAFSNKIPLLKLILLFIFSFGVYFIYWTFNNWNIINKHLKKKYSVFVWTLGSLIIIINFYVAFKQFTELENLIKKRKVKFLISVPAIIVLYFIGIMSTRFPSPFGFLFVLTLIPIVVVQFGLNNYWSKVESKKLKIKWLSFGEVACVLIGIVLAVLLALWLGGI